MNTCTSEFSSYEGLSSRYYESGKSIENQKKTPTQGVSGKTNFHHKFKSGKKPQGKFTSMKVK
ncbi:hypothetical protein [Chryseobacterium lathyri]|uniref:Uncharacterized protein n=1 Tax=Chryseobacterium lathyri TaxID=395933 RepID=A0A511YFW2_9FLAO|nr:hypothetical protein [Chryseobacterium lathyri]GEN74092.1 hypothetical protein CLA01_41640 [Chryseobacterium lathyri]